MLLKDKSERENDEICILDNPIPKLRTLIISNETTPASVSSRYFSPGFKLMTPYVNHN